MSHKRKVQFLHIKNKCIKKMNQVLLNRLCKFSSAYWGRLVFGQVFLLLKMIRLVKIALNVIGFWFLQYKCSCTSTNPRKYICYVSVRLSLLSKSSPILSFLINSQRKHYVTISKLYLVESGDFCNSVNIMNGRWACEDISDKNEIQLRWFSPEKETMPNIHWNNN